VRTQVLALCTCPSLLDDPTIVAALPADVVARAKTILNGTHGLGKTSLSRHLLPPVLPAGGAHQLSRACMQLRIAGAYSDSKGIMAPRESVKAYIEERDGFPTEIDDIYLTNGASEGTPKIGPSGCLSRQPARTSVEIQRGLGPGLHRRRDRALSPANPLTP